MRSFNDGYRSHRDSRRRVDKYSRDVVDEVSRDRNDRRRGQKRKHENDDTLSSSSNSNKQTEEIIYTDEYGDWVVSREAGPETAVKFKTEDPESIDQSSPVTITDSKLIDLVSDEKKKAAIESVDDNTISNENHDQVSVSIASKTLSTENNSDYLRLNKLKGQIIKAEMLDSPNLKSLRAEYSSLVEKLDESSTDKIVILDPKLQKLNSIKHSTEESTVSEMVHEELASRLRGDEFDKQLAMRIGKDAGYEDDEDYLVENAEKLSKISDKKQQNLHNQLVNNTRAMNDAISNCSLCIDADQSPAVTVLSSATRVYLCLAPVPTITKGVTCIVPFEHYRSTLDCDDDEWEEIRNYMKSLTRMWNTRNKGIVFYESAVSKSIKKHACIFAVPLSMELSRSAPAFFGEAMKTSDDEWAVHSKVIDTAKKASSMDPSYAKYAFRTSVAKEAPYFHVWFNINGGMCHIVENTAKWPSGDEFARQVLGGMLRVDPVLIRKKTSWQQRDPYFASIEPLWKRFDWVSAIKET